MLRDHTAERPVGVWLRRGVLGLIAALVVEYGVLPQLVGARSALDLVADVSPRTLLVALALEAASLLCYTAFTRSVLGRQGGLSFWTSLRIDLTGLGVSHVVPGGGATAAGLRFKLLTHAGVSARDAVTTTAIQTAVGICALIVVFTSGVALSLGSHNDHPVFAVAGVIALTVVLLVAGSSTALLRAPDRTRAVVRRIAARVPRLDVGATDRLVLGFATRVRELVSDRLLATRTAVWGFSNWLLDAACLWTCLRAFGWTESLGPLLAVYGLVNLLALLPVTPGGLGIVEGVLVPSLVAFGSLHAIALIGVLTWRLVEFWLPIPVSWVTYLSLRTGVFHDRDLEHRLMPTGRVAT